MNLKSQKYFQNESFGYNKITVERPWRLKDIEPGKVYSAKAIKEMASKDMIDENGILVIKKTHKGKISNPLFRLYETIIEEKKVVVEYE